MKVAIPSKGEKGLRDQVAETFSRAPIFTIITLEKGKVRNVEIVKNRASEMSQGAGPVAARTLKENKVDIVLVGDIGPGARDILETIDIRVEKVEPGLRVKEALEKWVKGA